MPCANPLIAYRGAREGAPVTFKRPQEQTYVTIELPCGTCILCREEQARQWAVRITHESQLHQDNSFLTLTYDDRHMPEHNSLHYADIQKFWKRLRKQLGPLRYYAVGEYGDKTNRPHYHACLFGHAFIEDRIILRTKPTLLWTTIALQRAWGLGNVSVGALTYESARYTAQYVTKKLRASQQYVRIEESTGELVPLEQPRAFMSRNIARGWWDQYFHQVVARDGVIIDGRPQKPPRAYDRWLKQRSAIAEDIVKTNRKLNAKKLSEEERRARARNAHARARDKKKSI